MKEGPDIALLGSLIGDPARANMLTALMTGKALTATELAGQAGVTVQTASAHLARLHTGGMLQVRKQGRHRYFALADDHVARLLETMMGVATLKGHNRVRTGPRDPALRQARVCYNHLAGERGVQMLVSMTGRGLMHEHGEDLELTPAGRTFASDFGIDFERLETGRRPLCKSCLDWSARRSHLAGSLGTAMLDQIYQRGWATRQSGTRIVAFTRTGAQKFNDTFPVGRDRR